MVCSYDMGKMGKTRTNTCTQKTSNRTNDSHSKIEKSTHNSVRTLQEKYKNILGSMQPIIVLEKCLIPKNILHQNSLRVSLKNLVNNTHNANDTSRLVYSTNHISHQSLCVEKANNQESVRNRKVDRSKSSKNRTKKAAVKKIDCSLGKVSLNTEASENVSKTSSTCSKRNTSLENSIPKSDSSSLEKIMEVVDTKNEVNAKLEVLQNRKCLKVCLERIVLYGNKPNIIINELNNLGHLRKNNSKEKMTLPKEYKTNTAIDSLVKRHNNYLTKHNTERTVVSTLESAKADDTSPLLTTNSYTSTLNAVNLEERLIVPSSNELRKHTKKRTIKQSQKSTIIEDTEDANTDSDTVQSSKRIMPSSNELSKHTKKHSVAHTQKSTIVGDTENVFSASTKNLINSPTDTGESVKRIIMPISSKLSKHTKKHTVTNTQKSTIIDDTEDANSDTDSEKIIMPSSNDLSKHTKNQNAEHTQKSTIVGDAENVSSASTKNFINSSTDTGQSFKRIIMPISRELSKHTKNHTLTHTQKSTIIEDTEDADNDSDTVQSFKRILPSSNELRKHTKKHTVAHNQKSTKVGDTKNVSSPSTSHFSNSSPDTVQSFKRILPSSNELRKHTKKHTVAHNQKSTKVGDTKNVSSPSTSNFSNSSTDIVQSSKRIIMPSSNELSKHTKNHSVGRTQKSIIITDSEDSDTDTVQSSKKIIMPSSNELSKLTKNHSIGCTQKSIIIKDAEDTDTHTVQSSKRIIMLSSNELTKQTKKHTVTHTQEGTIIEDKEDSDTVQSSKRIIMPSSNELSRHTKKHTVTHTQEGTIIEDKEDTDTVIVESSKKIMPSSSQLSKHTKRHTVTHTQKSTIVGDTKDTENASCPSTRNFINPPSDTVQSSERFITPRSNDSKKQTKESTVANNQKSIKLNEEISKENNVQRESLERRKRVHSMDSNSSQDLKKVKLNRSSWRKPLESANKTVDRSREVGITETSVKLKDNGKILQSIRTDVPGSSVAFPKEGNITYGVQVAKANLTEERGVSSIEKQISTETFGYSNRVESDARNDARKSLNAATEIRVLQNSATEIRKSVVEKTSFVSEDANFNNSCSLDDEDDCISLFADSMLVDEYDTTLSPQPQKSTMVAEKPYVMTDNVMDRFYKRNALEFNEAYNVNYSNNIKSRIIPRKEKPTEILSQSKDRIKIVSPMEPPVQPVPLMKAPAQPVPLMEVPVQPVKKSITSRLTLNPEKQTNNRDFSTIFRGFCYGKLRRGTCTKNSCHYRHQLTPFLMLLYEANETSFMVAINDLVQKKCLHTLQIFYNECIGSNANSTCILKLLKKFYDLGILGLQHIHNSIKLLIIRGSNANEIVDILATIVKDSDTLFVTNVSNAIVGITHGDVWSTLKPLLIRINILGEEVVKILLNECILTGKHIADVYENVVRKLDNKTLSRSTQDLVSMFRDILRKTSGNVEVQKPVASTSTISSPSSSNGPYVPYTMQTGNLSPKVWYNCIDDNNNAQRQNSTRLLHPTDNIPSPYSGRSRELFWKFYLNVHSLQEGLKYKDYNHVKKILDEAQEGDASLFTRACYKILWSNVEHSPTHLRELASLAVRDGATATYCKILIDLTIHILADLAARELWILAYELLKSFEVILHEQSLIKFDAVVLMLFCEIYLANRKPIKAYTLLKKSNIIYTSRGKWKVRNNEKDENIRAQIVTILLEMLCDTSPQYAYSLFEFLIADQSSNFKPIDLSYQANKLVSSLLLRKDHDELIVSIGQLINNYNCTLYPITYRKLISSLVHIDLPLAKQLYQIALLLGIYSKMQLVPMIYIIVKSDWTSEEMYLAIFAMMQELLENLGHAIDGVKPFNLPVHLVFEGTPSDKQLVRDKETSKRYENRIEESIALMKSVLETKFDPPLSMVKKRKGKFQKLNSMNLCRYLQCNQNFMQAI